MLRHPALIEEARWGLRALGLSEDFPDEVWNVARDDAIWRGVYLFAEPILARTWRAL
jgi:hypothetical protein